MKFVPPVMLTQPDFSAAQPGLVMVCTERQQVVAFHMMCQTADLDDAGESRTEDMDRVAEIVVRRYITNPLRIRDYACDLLLYVAVTKTAPLEAFVYNNGFLRFCQ